MSKSYKKHLEMTPNFKPVVYICIPYRGDTEKNVATLFGVRLTRICMEQSSSLHTIATNFTYEIGVVEEKYDDHYQQAVYAYSQIKGGVK